MKKFIALLVMVSVLFFFSFALAQAPTPSSPPDLNTIFGSLGINGNGDSFYLWRAHAWEGGAHVNMVSYKNIINFGPALAQGATGSPFYGGSFNVSIIPLLNLLGTNITTTSVFSQLNPSVGIVPGYNSTPGAKKFDFPIQISLGYTF